jgi:hypothetical protein
LIDWWRYLPGLERIPFLKPQNRPMLKDIVKNREEQSVRGPSEAKHEWDGQSPQDVGRLAEAGTDRQRWCSLNGPLPKTSARRHGRRPITSMVDLAVECRRYAEHDRALDLSLDGIGIDSNAAINRPDDPVDANRSVPRHLDFGYLAM